MILSTKQKQKKGWVATSTSTRPTTAECTLHTRDWRLFLPWHSNSCFYHPPSTCLVVVSDTGHHEARKLQLSLPYSPFSLTTTIRLYQHERWPPQQGTHLWQELLSILSPLLHLLSNTSWKQTRLSLTRLSCHLYFKRTKTFPFLGLILNPKSYTYYHFVAIWILGKPLILNHKLAFNITIIMKCCWISN